MRYKIWDKKESVITPIGEVLSAEQWIDRYPVAGIESIKVVCAAGELNGAFFGTLGQMVDMYERQGVDFSECTTDQEKLDAISEFEEYIPEPSTESTPEERIAAALEYNNLLNTPAIREDDPDVD